MKYMLVDMFNNKEHEILTTQSVYEIPSHEIKSNEDVYDFYKDATLSLNEAYQYVLTQLPQLTNITFPAQPIETFQREIEGIFYLLQSQN